MVLEFYGQQFDSLRPESFRLTAQLLAFHLQHILALAIATLIQLQRLGVARFRPEFERPDQRPEIVDRVRADAE